MLRVKICSKHVLQENLSCFIELSNFNNFLFVSKRGKQSIGNFDYRIKNLTKVGNTNMMQIVHIQTIMFGSIII